MGRRDDRVTETFSLIVALLSGLILLYVEFAYFQGRWPSSRN
jgi:hypothetical protein